MKALTKLKKALIKKPVSNTPVKRAIQASNYIRQYGDKGYVPSNGVGVGGSPTGEQKLQKIKKIDPGSLRALPLKKKKQYAPSNAGYSNFAWY